MRKLPLSQIFPQFCNTDDYHSQSRSNRHQELGIINLSSTMASTEITKQPTASHVSVDNCAASQHTQLGLHLPVILFALREVFPRAYHLLLFTTQFEFTPHKELCKQNTHRWSSSSSSTSSRSCWSVGCLCCFCRSNRYHFCRTATAVHVTRSVNWNIFAGNCSTAVLSYQ